MADDSGDSDIEPRPSCSKSRRSTRGSANHGGGNCTDSRRGRKRRIVMRIEFDDSDEDSSSASAVSSDDGKVENMNTSNESPSSSKRTRRTRRNNRTAVTTNTTNADESDESDGIQKNMPRRLRNRRSNLLYMDGSDSDGSSSSSEIDRSVKTRVNKSAKKIIISEDEQICSEDEAAAKEDNKQNEATEAGFNSDSSSNELLEKCPICLLTFRQQEIGSPATCAHIFCSNCIEAWSKNVQTCPIDRIEFDRIIVRENHENRKIVREIIVDPNKVDKELLFAIEDGPAEEDITCCEICNSPDREDVMLLCDECNQGYHMDCLTPRLAQIPEGTWYCDNCFDTSAESDNVSEDLNLLYEDIRDMGIPQAALRVTELQQPRILRTRQNERIRAAVLRTTRSRAARIEMSTTTTTRAGISRGRGRPRSNTTTTTTTTTTRTTRAPSTRRKPSRRRRRRRARKRTYVVEYDLNNFDEKFAIKTTKKIIKRRRRKRRASKRNPLRGTTDGRMTASKRLAEQLGVKKDPTYSSHISGSSTGFSLFGGANDLEYFSDSDNGGIEHEIELESGHGTAVQTSIRISNFGSQRACKGLLLGRLQGNNRRSVIPDLSAQTAAPAGGDLLSSIMNIQDRWHNAARNMENVHISADGILQLPTDGKRTDNGNVKANADSNAPQTSTPRNSSINEQPSGPINPLEGVMQAPMYSRGGGNQNFGSGGGGGGGGNYNNRYNSNQNNFRGGGGGSGQYRHSTGGDGGGNSNHMAGRGNFNFSGQNFNNSNNNPNPNFSPFTMRFNQRNNQRNNNQRNSLPLMHRNDDDRQQSQNSSQNAPNDGNTHFGGMPPLQQIAPNDNPLFGDLPPPVMGGPPVLGPSPLMPGGPMAMTGPPPMSGPPLMTGPPPMAGPPIMPGPPQMPGPPPIMGPLPMAGPPPSAMGMSGPPPSLTMHSPMQSIRPLMTVPPPPAPPPGVPMPWATPIFQQLNNDYGNDDDDSNCPNFSVYSAESQEVAKSTEMQLQTQQEDEAVKEDDENEDLVQLDDDDEIPMPPETNPNQSTAFKDSDLYEPENPTEENDDGDEELEEQENEHENNEDENEDGDKNKENINVKVQEDDENVESASETATPDHSKPDGDAANGYSQYDPEHEILSNDEGSDMDLEKVDENLSESNKSCHEPSENEVEKSEERSIHTPSPAVSESKLPESDLGTASKKGVLELYDDSDWEELDIDKPKEYAKAAQEAEKSELEEGQLEEEPEKVKERSKKNKDKGKTDDEKSEGEPDRSYTPCLDENNEPEEGPENGHANEAGAKSLNTSKISNAEPEDDGEIGGQTPEIIATEPTAIETELISDDDDNARGAKKRKSSKKREKRDKKIEAFKKVSNKQKIRNYRTDKQQADKVKNQRRVSKSRSRSRSKSGTKSRTRTPTRSHSRIRSRSRSPRPVVSRSRSPSYSVRSRSRTPRGRTRRRSRSRSYRSNSRSNNKENHWRPGGRYHNNINYNNRFQDRNRFQNQYRPKRREMPRYNVRNVVGMQRNFRDNREVRDRYGRDATRQVRNISRSPSPRDRRVGGGRSSFSRSRSRGRSMSPRRNRRGSFSISLSPQPLIRHSISPRQRYHSPRRHSLSPRRITPMRAHSRTPLRMRSRSLTPQRIGGRKVMRRARGNSPLPQPVISRSPSRLRSMSASPRYTPRLHRSRSKTPILRAAKGKKKKLKEKGKKKKKKRLPTMSPDTNIRISRQRDAFEVDRPPKKKRRHSPKQKAAIEEPTWSPSPSPPPVLDYERDNNISWTPPLMSPRLIHEMHGIYEPEPRRSTSRSSKRDKRKRQKKKKKGEKRRDVRKDKRRVRRTQTPEPMPSKEVFASGNNILVSVSFNKDAATNQTTSQTTVVTVPPSRDDLHTNRRNSMDSMNALAAAASKKKKKRKKLDAKPIAIIDLERSPFQVHQEPADVIVLTDSEEGAGGHDSEHDHDHDHDHDRDHEHEHEHGRRRESHRERRRSESIVEEMDHHRSQMSNGVRSSSQLDKTPPLERERLETILEESYDLPQTGPKTPPEPPTVKFNMPAKKQSKVRNNPLHDEAELISESEMAEVREPDTHRSELEPMHVQSSQKIGPNTPPESGPCSPDAYDPFDPTKSPSISPRSPSPAPMNSSQGSIGGDGVIEVVPTQKHIGDEQRLPNERNATVAQITSTANSLTTQGPTLNPVELVMKLMNTKQNSSQDLKKSNEPQYGTATHMHSTLMGNVHDDGLGMRDKNDEQIGLNVLSNVLLSNGNAQASQHIPVISSPAPIMKSNQISKLPLPKVGSSVGSSSGAGLPSSNSNARNGGLDLDLEMESPYSPGSADYDDLFDPPPESATRRTKRGNNIASGKLDMFDNLFGSTSPVGHTRMSKRYKAIVTSSMKKSKIKVSKTDDHIKVYDDLPNSAVELQVKDKFLRKLNRQERVVEEVKFVLKPRFNKKQITKDDYKEIMRRAVPKICHSRSGEINPHKIKNLIDAYVRKFRAKHKKLNLLNTGQVSSAVKCAAYLKKL